jgi:hypothetical protein
MKEYGYWNKENGYWQEVNLDDTPPNDYKDTIIVDLKPAEYYDFDGEKWILNNDKKKEVLIREIKTKRNKLLKKYVDDVSSNNARWSSFTTQQKNSIKKYRQQLLDISDQKEFPYEVEWPEIPEFIK